MAVRKRASEHASLKPRSRLVRETFQTSRLLEFCSEKELVAQTGHEVKDWPFVIAKELIDNAIDGAEEYDIAPLVAVSISRDTGEIIITDNGFGITTETVDGIIDYTVRVSSREAYPSPTRGRQGNALKTIIAMPYVLDGNVGETVIEALGIAHRIQFRTDAIRQEPRVECARSPSTVKNGTRVTVRLPETACRLLDAAERFLPFVQTFIALNPHLTITLDLDGERVINWSKPTDRGWQKWRPSDPIPAHWHTPETLQRHMAACINRDRQHDERVRSVRDFVAGFRGLHGTAKQKQVLYETGLFRAPLDAFFADNQADGIAIAGLLTAMQRNSNPVRPQVLGVIGKAHFHHILERAGADPESFNYHRIFETDRDGLPFVVEAAFASATVGSRIAGLNWSPGIVNPFRSLSAWQSLDSVLAEQHVHNDDQVVMVAHLTCPVVQFTDRGKSAATLTYPQRTAIIDSVRNVTKSWSDAHEASQRKVHREYRSLAREVERMLIEERKQERERERTEKAREKAERAARRRTRNEIVGTGPLYREIADAAEAAGCSIKSLYVLDPKYDPYAVDTTEGHANGKWFAERVAGFLPDGRRIHIRGLHYSIAASADVRRPDGTPYVNDDKCSDWLETKAAKSARLLKYVPFERIVDERNEEPTVIWPGSDAAQAHWSFGHPLAVLPLPPTKPFHIDSRLPGVVLPRLNDLMPEVTLADFTCRQPYRIILFGEKPACGQCSRRSPNDLTLN